MSLDTLGGKPDRLASGAAPVSGDGARLQKARAMRETLAAKLLQMAVEREEGRIIDREAAQRIWVDAITEAKTRIESIAERVAPLLVGPHDVRVVRRILRSEVAATMKLISKAPNIGNETNFSPARRQ